MENMDSMDGMTKVHYIVPSRGLIGFMTNFLTMTRVMVLLITHS